MAAGTSFCLIFILLFGFSGAQTNIRPENITAEVGQDVILPCKVPNNTNITAVEWNRPDQEPEYVLFNRDGHFVPDQQHPSYQNRVDLQDKDMKDGNFSLILKNVTKNDTGRYECWVFEEGKNELINIINLVVYLPGDKDGTIVGSAVGVILLLAVVSVGFLIYRQHMKKNPHLPVPCVEPPPIEIPAVPESPVEPPTASEALMEAPAEEQSENVK